jgi:ADP-ribose pyrophosphatase YjhB (NUDIX family)
MYCQQCGAPTVERTHDGRSRPVCTACGAVTYLDPKLAVAVLIEREGCVLLGQRGEGTREPGKWSFPAGFVERGERVEAAAAREVAEEVGLAITVGDLIGLYSADGEAVVLAVFTAAGVSGGPVAADDLTAVEWFPLDHLPELAFPHDLQVIDDWRRHKTSRIGSDPIPASAAPEKRSGG